MPTYHAINSPPPLYSIRELVVRCVALGYELYPSTHLYPPYYQFPPPTPPLSLRELVVRCVALGYELAVGLMVFDEIHLAQLLQDALVTLTAALQTIPKR